MKKKVLIVDDDPDIVLMLTDRLRSLRYQTFSAGNGLEAMDILEQEAPHLMLLDMEMPRMTGMEVLHCLAQSKAQGATDSRSSSEGDEGLDLPVIVMTAYGTISKAVEAMKAGASDFLTKPVDLDHLSIVLKKALAQQDLKRQVAFLRHEAESRYGTIVGSSPCIVALIELAKRAADSDVTVLLSGESGTGKELLARSIHHWSNRRAMPFSIVNCVAITETLLENELFGHEKGAFTGADTLKKGLIEEADGGTVFFDEIGDMPVPLQAKLLRLLQDQEFPRVGGTRLVKVNIRVIAATNKDLNQAVQAGTFREDLFFRLNVVNLTLSPLRNRPVDIIPLAEYFLARHVHEMKKSPRTFSPKAVSAMRRYAWPGNIRELDNAIARAVVLGNNETVTPEHLCLTTGGGTSLLGGDNVPYHEALENYSRHILEQAMRRCSGNQTKAAELLGLQRTYLSRLLRQKKIQEPQQENN